MNQIALSNQANASTGMNALMTQFLASAMPESPAVRAERAQVASALGSLMYRIDSETVKTMAHSNADITMEITSLADALIEKFAPVKDAELIQRLKDAQTRSVETTVELQEAVRDGARGRLSHNNQ